MYVEDENFKEYHPLLFLHKNHNMKFLTAIDGHYHPGVV
jgi:hypothetical protein